MSNAQLLCGVLQIAWMKAPNDLFRETVSALFLYEGERLENQPCVAVSRGLKSDPTDISTQLMFAPPDDMERATVTTGKDATALRRMGEVMLVDWLRAELSAAGEIQPRDLPNLDDLSSGDDFAQLFGEIEGGTD